MDPFLEKLVDDVFGMALTSGFDSWEEEGQLFLRLEVPGYDKEKISVTSENGSIIVEATREQPKREYLVRSTLDKFRKRIMVPQLWSLEKIDASYKDGVLTLVVERAEGKKSKKVQIK